MIDYEIIDHPPAHLGEGPIWDYRSRRFLWVDAYSDGFYTLDLDVHGSFGTPRHWRTDAFTIGLALLDDVTKPNVGASSSYLLTSAEEIAPYVMDANLARSGRSFQPYDETALRSGAYRYNDVSAVPGGFFLAGIMPRRPGGDRHRSQMGSLVGYGPPQRPEGVEVGVAEARVMEPRVVITDVRLSNGIGWSPDNRWMYYTDTLRNGIFRYPTEMILEIIEGTRQPISLAEAHRPFIAVTDVVGVPDGLTVAADGTIFSARWGGGAVDRYDPQGKRIETFEVPAQQPSSIAFGGDDLSTMLITSATEGLDEAERTPQDGRTFLTSRDVKGRREPLVQF